MDLIKTIEDNEEIKYESDSSKDGEDEDPKGPPNTRNRKGDSGDCRPRKWGSFGAIRLVCKPHDR